MTARKYSSTYEVKTLGAPMTSSTTDAADTMTLNSITGFTTYPYTLVIDPDTASEEIVTVVSLASGNILNIVRGQDGSPATSHLLSSPVKHMVTARDLQEPQNHMDAVTNIHGIADTTLLANSTNTLTLSGKSISGSTNTLTNIPTSALASKAGTGSSVVTNQSPTINGAEITAGSTLSNSTITGTTITTSTCSDTIREAGASVVQSLGTPSYVVTLEKNLSLAGTSSCTVTLPTASAGRELRIVNKGTTTIVSASSNVYPRTGTTLGTAICSATAGSWVLLVANGTNWYIMAGS